MTSIPQCWAYGNRGRCEKNAGHTGKHSIEHTWTDAECLDPTTQSTPATPKTDISRAEKQDGCIACNHTHESGPCKCGCYEHIN